MSSPGSTTAGRRPTTKRTGNLQVNWAQLSDKLSKISYKETSQGGAMYLPTYLSVRAVVFEGERFGEVSVCNCCLPSQPGCCPALSCALRIFWRGTAEYLQLSCPALSEGSNKTLSLWECRPDQEHKHPTSPVSVYSSLPRPVGVWKQPTRAVETRVLNWPVLVKVSHC